MNTQQQREYDRLMSLKRSGRRLTTKQKYQITKFEAIFECDEKSSFNRDRNSQYSYA